MSLTVTIQRPQRPQQLYMHAEDAAIFGVVRGNAPCPAVFWLVENQMKITREWQYYLIAINRGMALQYVSHLLNNSVAYCNGHGFPADPGEAPYKNYILNEDLDAPDLPAFNKVFTHARACHVGTEVTAASGNKFLLVEAMDGTRPPLLKPGYRQPAKISEINPDAYVFTPWTHRHLFSISNNVTDRGKLFPFDNGARYSWMGDSWLYTFMPLVSKVPVLSPLNHWVKLPAGRPYVTPYLS